MRVPRYVLEKVLGFGSMGVVYRAHDRILGRTVTIKTIRKELISKDSEYRAYRDRFFHEAHIFGSLSHPNIVALYDVGETDDGLPYLTMEYVPDASLGALDRRLSLDQVIWLLAQLASAIDYAHTREILHRDIKPTNILLGEGEEAKIADFGVAKILGAEFTRSQTRFGTPGYMSPEQVLGKTLTRSSDVFSLAVVAFELLSGRKPFPGKVFTRSCIRSCMRIRFCPPGSRRPGLWSRNGRNCSRALSPRSRNDDTRRRPSSCPSSSSFVPAHGSVACSWMDFQRKHPHSKSAVHTTR